MISKEKMVAVGGGEWIRIEDWATGSRKDFRLLINQSWPCPALPSGTGIQYPTAEGVP